MRPLFLCWLGCSGGDDEASPESVPDPPESVPEETAGTGDTAPPASSGDTGTTTPVPPRRYLRLSAGEQLTCALFDDGGVVGEEGHREASTP